MSNITSRNLQEVFAIMPQWSSRIPSKVTEEKIILLSLPLLMCGD